MPEIKWNHWGVSIEGPSHQLLNQPNQDAWEIANYTWGSVLVMSDGLGSRKHSDKGAQSVCYSVIEAAKFWGKNPAASIEDVLNLISALWLVRIAPFPLADCSATCLFAITIREELILGRLGDGLIIAVGKDDAESVIVTDTKENSFSNMTVSMSGKHNPDLWEIKRMNPENLDAVIMCTDGVSDDIVPEKQLSFGKELCKHYRNYSRKEINRDVHRWLKDWPVAGHTDDKTIACLSRRV